MLSYSLWLSLSPSLSLSLSFFLSVSLLPTTALSLIGSLPPSLSLAHSDCFSRSLIVSLSVPLALSLSPSPRPRSLAPLLSLFSLLRYLCPSVSRCPSCSLAVTVFFRTVSLALTFALAFRKVWGKPRMRAIYIMDVGNPSNRYVHITYVISIKCHINVIEFYT